MKVLDGIVGYASEAAFSERIHHIKHLDRVEYVTISPDDVARRRFRLKTDKGTDWTEARNTTEIIYEIGSLKWTNQGYRS